MLGHGDLTKTGRMCRYHGTSKTKNVTMKNNVNLKIKYEIYYDIELLYSRGGKKIKILSIPNKP